MDRPTGSRHVLERPSHAWGSPHSLIADDSQLGKGCAPGIRGIRGQTPNSGNPKNSVSIPGFPRISLEHPEMMSQGRTLNELEENVRDAYRLMTMDDVPVDHQIKAITL